MQPILEGLARSRMTLDEKVEFLRPIVDEMRDMDWDTLDECLGIDPAFDRIYGEIYHHDGDNDSESDEGDALGEYEESAG